MSTLLSLIIFIAALLISAAVALYIHNRKWRWAHRRQNPFTLDLKR